MTCTSGSTDRNRPVKLSDSPMQSLREQSQLGLALLWPREGDGEKGGDGEEGVDGLLLQALPPERAASSGEQPWCLPGAASRGIALQAPPKPGCGVLVCLWELQLCTGDFGTQSSVLMRNHELKELLSLETENLISWRGLQRSWTVVRGREHLCRVSFRNLVREIYEQWEIHGQTSVNFGQSSIKEQKDFLAC